MINITDKSQCCGCNACVQRCPKQCVTMQEDEEGFLYPKVDHAACIDCGLCEKVCPVINKNESRRPMQVFAVKNNNEDQRLRSSSGGIFILLAEQTIKRGGVVFGARFDKDWEVEHCYVETLKELELLMRSKYVQSRIGDSFKQAEHFLKQGRQVMFVGTPCHISALKKFLKKDYKTLLAVDIVCHGVPSPGVWRRYLRETVQGDIGSVNFRAKQLSGYTWAGYGIEIRDLYQKKVLFSQQASQNPYMKAFVKGAIMRPSCFSCPSKDWKNQSDLTIGDFWGISNHSPEINDNIGLALTIINTPKGSEVIAQCPELTTWSKDVDIAVSGNPSVLKSRKKPLFRDKFWILYMKNKPISYISKKLFNEFACIMIIARIKAKICCLMK